MPSSVSIYVFGLIRALRIFVGDSQEEVDAVIDALDEALFAAYGPDGADKLEARDRLVEAAVAAAELGLSISGGSDTIN